VLLVWTSSRGSNKGFRKTTMIPRNRCLVLHTTQHGPPRTLLHQPPAWNLGILMEWRLRLETHVPSVPGFSCHYSHRSGVDNLQRFFSPSAARSSGAHASNGIAR
jgi:hypothetical protein